ncbi:hypothetical protein M413DRAFT_22952 [Hebeloma cylindrosporum]|uniref:Uncharacterized protein n=1 Tax=Hebeloma cylindrosporum TaxID=76867 RepID=A0A0C3CWD1_HEBCY|nr:hypothetical protein M413DRAFT_22952 [Hebeloma cylindrosporum h7]
MIVDVASAFAEEIADAVNSVDLDDDWVEKLLEIDDEALILIVYDDWVEKLLEIDDEALILIVCELCNKVLITNKRIKYGDRISHPSFSTLKWDQLASSFSLPEEPEDTDLDTFVTTTAAIVSQSELRVGMYIVAILALFRGRLIDKAEQDMPVNEYITGGDAAHKVFMVGGVLFFVLEMKFQGLTSDNLAQLFLEFLSASTLNKRRNFQQLRIYGVLTDLSRCHVYSYDPVQIVFSLAESLFLITIDNYSYLVWFRFRITSSASY